MAKQQTALMRAIAAGTRLMDHRDIDGRKTFVLHAEDGSSEAVNGDDVQALVEAGLIDSNKKFPAATYWLTDAGRALLAARPRATNPLAPTQ